MFNNHRLFRALIVEKYQGLPIEFDKTFKEKLLVSLLKIYDKSYQNGTLPPSLRLAMITLILKPDKPPTECSSFRPLCRVLAKRLDSYIPHLVHHDQTGFVQKRQGFHIIESLTFMKNFTLKIQQYCRWMPGRPLIE